MRIRQEQTSGFADPDTPTRLHQQEHVEETIQELTDDTPVSQFAGSLLLDESFNFSGEPTPELSTDITDNDAK
jgi:hypothetical protein